MALVVMLYRRMARVERGLCRARGQLAEVQREMHQGRLTLLAPAEDGPDAEPPEATRKKGHLLLIPGGIGAGAAIATKIRTAFETHTVAATTITATVAGLTAASILWGAAMVVDTEADRRPSAVPATPQAPGGETIPPEAMPTPTAGSDSPRPSPTGPADTGPGGEPRPTSDQAPAVNAPTPAGDSTTTTTADPGTGDNPPPAGTTSGTDGGTGTSPGDEEPSPSDDAGGTDGATSTDGSSDGGTEQPTDPPGTDGLICIGLTLPPLLDVDRLCLL
ncbi:hypothetical protein [Streptomyces phytophilus]|uniref:hypothetical protein n=1 Tax=Streptomyces phytophilus TaxID=722715 RepID=UPI0015F0001D|nr:hypothetical protein [Streptomyces phytophilus]